MLFVTMVYVALSKLYVPKQPEILKIFFLKQLPGGVKLKATHNYFYY